MNNILSLPSPISTDRYQGSTNATSNAAGGFYDALSDAVESVSGLHADATSKVSGVLNGEGQDIHSAMIAVERADLAFQLVLQVRNKVVNAYQEVAHMQF